MTVLETICVQTELLVLDDNTWNYLIEFKQNY